MTDILNMTALEIGEAIKQKQITVTDAVLAVLGAIDKVDGEINAYITVNCDEALKKAQEVQKKIDSGELTGALAGVPIAIKDNICTKNIKTTCASKMLETFVPCYDATVIERLENAGAVILGKLNMDEFAMGSTGETSYFGATKNPWNKQRVTGGSSSGAAGAVASKTAVLTLGSDTGGSIRQPASYCGVTGFKPTYGTVSRYGLVAHASSLDQIGPLAKNVADCAAVMDIVSGIDPKDSTTLNIGTPEFLKNLSDDISGMKVALPRECFEIEGIDPEISENVRRVADVLRSKGAVVEEINLSFLDFGVADYYIISSAEASSNLSRFDGVKYGFRADSESLSETYSKSRSEGFGDEVKRRILLGTFVLSSGFYDAYYNKALKVKRIIKEAYEKVFCEYDAILCPTAPTTAPIKGQSLQNPLQMYLSDIFTVSVNIAGLPALSLPCGFDKNGLPIGAQFIGPQLGEQKVLNIGFAYQNATDFHKRRAEVM